MAAVWAAGMAMNDNSKDKGCCDTTGYRPMCAQWTASGVGFVNEEDVMCMLINPRKFGSSLRNGVSVTSDWGGDVFLIFLLQCDDFRFKVFNWRENCQSRFLHG